MDSGAAKQFLLSAIVEQAVQDGAALSQNEIGLFLFSEAADGADAFDSDDDDAYEAKITKLLRHAYAKDKQDSIKLKIWNEALDAVRNEDFYGLVMVDQARIPRPGMNPVIAARTGLQFVKWKDILFGVFALALLSLAFMLASDRSSLMRPLPDWAKLLGAAAAIVVLWQVSKIYVGRRTRV